MAKDIGIKSFSEPFSKKNIKKIIISFILALIILFFLFSRMDFNRTFETLSKANIMFVLLAFVAHYLTMPVRALRWQILFKSIGFKQKLWNLTEIVFLAQFMNSILPAKLGEVYRAHVVKKNYNVSISENLGIIFIEKIFDLLILVAMLIASSYFLFGKTFPETIHQLILIALVIVIASIVVVFFLRIRIFEKIKFLPNFTLEILNRFNKGLNLPIKYSIPVTFYTILNWFLEIASLYFVLLALSIHLDFWLIIFVVLASSLLTAVPFTPAGLGAVELGIIGIFAITGINSAMAFSILILFRIVVYWSHILMGFPAYIISKKS